MEAFTRSRRRRDERAIRCSTWQYHPQHLVFHRASLWCMVPVQSLERILRQHTPEHVRDGWQWILSRGREGTEGEAERTAIWIAENGPRLGFRTPDVGERSAALGLTELDQHMELTEEERFNAQGNAMDVDILQCRIAPLIRAWADPTLGAPRHSYPAPYLIRRYQEQLRHTVLAAYGPDGEGRLDESDLHDIQLPHVDPVTGYVEDISVPQQPSGPAGRGDW